MKCISLSFFLWLSCSVSLAAPRGAVSQRDLEKAVTKLLGADERILRLSDLEPDAKTEFESQKGSQGPGLVCVDTDDAKTACGVLTVDKSGKNKSCRRFLVIGDVLSNSAKAEAVEDFRKDTAKRTNVFVVKWPKSKLQNRGQGPDTVEMKSDGISRVIEGQSNLVIFYDKGNLNKVSISD